MPIERFSVDARLLRELGERLVGKPHIALAEIIKNSYDADARVVDLYFTDNCIRIVDDGHGMSHADFSKRWLTIGTTVKESSRVSPELKRPFTGSKGVGRLSVQLLARELELRTVGLRDPALSGRQNRLNAARSQLSSEIDAYIDWDSAVKSGFIENVDVEVIEQEPSQTFANGSSCGTELILRRLVTDWDGDSFRDLARELWPLQPPFDAPEDDEAAFRVNLHSPHSQVVAEFEQQMQAILDIWTARITGVLLPVGARIPEESVYHLQGLGGQSNLGSSIPDRLLRVKVDLRQSSSRVVYFHIDHCRVDKLNYEIRVFTLQHRQPRGVRVDLAREYLLAYGGVHIYDAKFHLPYYGPDIDWLNIEQDHARRLSASRLLPSSLQVSRGMLDLVPNTRIYGTVDISTTHEADAGEQQDKRSDDVLRVQITRDRLAENTAFQEVVRLVRIGMDLYAMESARAKFAETREQRSRESKPPSGSMRDTQQRLREMREVIPPENRPEFEEIERQVADVVADAQAAESAAAAQTGLMAALATAGMTTLAYEHEILKQIAETDRIARDVTDLAEDAPEPLQSSLRALGGELAALAFRIRRINQIFAALSDEETRNSEDAGSVYVLAQELAGSLKVLSRDADINLDNIPRDLEFPKGGYPAWWAVLQNLIVNALNATLDTSVRQIDIDGSGSRRRGWIRVQDTGLGLKVNDSERLFEPFERGDPISRERAALGLGGMGLGLTIVRLVCDELGVRVVFEAPDSRHSTAIRISWSFD